MAGQPGWQERARALGGSLQPGQGGVGDSGGRPAVSHFHASQDTRASWVRFCIHLVFLPEEVTREETERVLGSIVP